MTAEEMKARTKALGLCVLRLAGTLPAGGVGGIIGRQLGRAGTSVGANHRAACRAQSRRDFAAKLGLVEEECDETIYWLESLIESGLMRRNVLDGLMKEADEILAIIVASIRTSRTRMKLRPQSAIRNRRVV